MNNGVMRIIYGIFKVISVLFIICIFSIIFIQRVSNNDIKLGGYSIYTVVSESMYPKYKLWDMILAREVDVSEIEKYDDVVYMGKEGDFSDRIVTHRVMDIRKEGDNYFFRTKGISNSEYDPEISGDQIMGRVVYKSVVLSFISKIINNIYGFYFVVFVPLTIILFLEIVESINERRKIKKEE